MDEKYLVREKEIGKHRVRVYYEICPQCPIEAGWDLLGLFLWNTDRCGLSDACSWREVFGNYGKSNDYSINEALRNIISNHITPEAAIKYIKKHNVGSGMALNYDRSRNIWILSHVDCGIQFSGGAKSTKLDEFTPDELRSSYFIYELAAHMSQDEQIDIIDKCVKDIVVVEWSSSGYSQGDYVEGIAFCDRERFVKRGFEVNKDWREKAKEVMLAESEDIGKWMWGDVYGFTLEEKVEFTKHYKDNDKPDEDGYEWEQIDSCWGYYEEPDEVIRLVIEEHDLKETA